MKQISESNPLQDFFEMDIRPYISLKEFEPDEFIIREGERPTYLYYLLEGRAKLFISQENGSISLINFIEAPCFIGEMELLDANRLPQGVKAISTCSCYQIDISGCGDRILRDVKFLRYLCRFLSTKATQNTDNYMRNQSYSLKIRLAEFILKMAVNGYYREPHTEAAEFLGVTYRHLLYVLAQFVKEGILQKTKQGYEVKKPEALRGLIKNEVHNSQY